MKKLEVKTPHVTKPSVAWKYETVRRETGDTLAS